MKKTLTLACVLAASLSASALAASTIKIVNKSGWDLHEIYFSPTSQDDWGEDHLGSQILEQGDALTLYDVAAGRWDIRLVDEDGDECVLSNVHITESDRWVVTEEDLLVCQAATN